MYLSAGSITNWLNDLLHFDKKFLNHLINDFKVYCTNHVAESNFIVCDSNNIATLIGILNGYLEYSGETRRITAFLNDDGHIVEFKLTDPLK